MIGRGRLTGRPSSSSPPPLLASPPSLLQLAATCNVEQSFFNDWFSGHLNFQIEHQ